MSQESRIILERNEFLFDMLDNIQTQIEKLVTEEDEINE